MSPIQQGTGNQRKKRGKERDEQTRRTAAIPTGCAALLTSFSVAVHSLWEGPWQEWALPNYLRSLVALEDGGAAELDAFLHASSRDEAKLAWLDKHMSAELAIAATVRGDWARAAHHCRRGYRRFVEVWSGLHPCAVAARHSALKALQRLVEVEELADVALSVQSRLAHRSSFAPEEEEEWSVESGVGALASALAPASAPCAYTGPFTGLDRRNMVSER